MMVSAEDVEDATREVDPRVERSRDLVVGATIDLLSEVGYGSLAIEAVAARAGVAKSTIYRHWPGKDELVAAAFARLRDQTDVAPPPGPVHERIGVMLRALAVKVLDPGWRSAACMPAVIDSGERSEEMARQSARMAEERARPMVEVIDEAIAAGELPPTTDAAMVVDSLIGPILLRRLFHRRAFDPDAVPALVDQVLGPRS